MGNHLTSQSGLPHIRQRENKGSEKGRKIEHVEREGGGSFVSHFLLLFIQIALCSQGGRGRDARVSSFFHPVCVLPGAVQFLDPSLSSSSRLLLSISCSSFLPPHLSWSSLLWTETSKPGLEQKRRFQHRYDTRMQHSGVQINYNS